MRLTAKRWQVVMESPIANGADPLTLGALCSSAADAYTTNTRTNVIKNSIPKAWKKKYLKPEIND